MSGSKKMEFLRNGLFICIASMSLSTHASIALSTPSDWSTNISGSVPVFFVNSNFDTGENASRIQSGFNPANVTFLVSAPTSSGITVSTRVELDMHLQGSRTQNSGLFESRVTELQIDGEFGTVNIGKGFGVFNSSAIGDLGSALGVGFLGGGADTGDATGGRIGSGYVYANFNPRIIYTTPNMNGVIAKVGIFNPEEPVDAAGIVETSLPRIEGQLNYSIPLNGASAEVWAGFMWQDVDLVVENTSYSMQGYDVGAHISLGNAALRLSYTDTKGIGADGLYGIGGIADANVDGSQWYGETYYRVGKTTTGISYGEGDQQAHSQPFLVPDITNKLTMGYIQHRLTEYLTVMLELQSFQSNTAPGDYDAVVLGTQFDF